MEIRAVLATNLRRLRDERGLSQEELAHRAAIDRTYVSAIERRVYGVTIDVLSKIARALDVDEALLLERGPAGPSGRVEQ